MRNYVNSIRQVKQQQHVGLSLGGSPYRPDNCIKLLGVYGKLDNLRVLALYMLKSFDVCSISNYG